MIVIGDVHGRIEEYLSLRSKFQETLQLGDMGFDYSKITESDYHFFFKGDQDNFQQWHTNSLHYFGMFKDQLFYISGAQSANRDISCNTETELTSAQCVQCLIDYIKAKPSIVVSHDCPQFLVPQHSETVTRKLLQELWEEWQPDLWVYGHHHTRQDLLVNKTRFVGLEEMGCFNVTTGTFETS